MSALRYVARPIQIEAVEWRGSIHDIPATWRRSGSFWFDGDGLVMQTGKGEADVNLGDHIVRRRTGEMYPVDPVTFAEHYEAVTTP